ncbi:tail fiber domain-containing protein [Parapedobacter sp. 10938]|uniref:tail fiber domain-containing protein n=1 Tax=Parapedobacter flavus TaxID=3110225 RepID=UPI002DBA2290|nr:tail fiber domain-containing protein [Parapedobacter sp. 10938]MEC3878633.1 tail fiber domain-containing protein [Parapedobacter sp. 10938]
MKRPFKVKSLIVATIVMLGGALYTQAQVKVIANGNVGIGVTTPTNKFQMNGLAADFINSSQLRLGVFSSDPRIQSSSSKVVFYNMANTGHVAVHVSNVITSSDERLKANISGISGNALDLVKQLRPVTYNFKSGSDKQLHAGFLAQELEKVIPHVVSRDDSVGIRGVAYQEIIPYLVEAIKEQQTIIDGLKSRLDRVDVVAVKEEE